MRALGLDVGDATIGVAVSDSLLMTAQGRETIRRTTVKEDIDKLIDYIINEEIGVIVVGLPLNMNGSLGPQAEKTQQFARRLEKKVRHTNRLENNDIPIEFWDERLTTMAAERMLIQADVSREKRKKVVDKMAAAFILQGYLDKNRDQLKG